MEERQREERLSEVRNKRRQKEERNRNILIICAVAVVVFFVVIAVFRNQLIGSDSDDKMQGQQGQQQIVETEHAEYGDSDDIYWNPDTKEARVYLNNSANNQYNMKYTIALKETGEIIYESEVLLPGEEIVSIKLELPYTEGEYDVTISADSYNAATGDLLNGVIYSKKLYIVY